MADVLAVKVYSVVRVWKTGGGNQELEKLKEKSRSFAPLRMTNKVLWSG
jgi:hypothetical protein